MSIPILGPQHQPTGSYTPKVGSAEVESTKDLLLFMRVEGFRCDHLEVTDKGVLIHGLTDDYPSKRQTSASPPAGASRVASYEDPADPNDV